MFEVWRNYIPTLVMRRTRALEINRLVENQGVANKERQLEAALVPSDEGWG